MENSVERRRTYPGMAAKGQTCQKGLKFSVGRQSVFCTLKKAKGTVLLILQISEECGVFSA